MAIFQCSADVLVPIMDRISLVFQWLESKKMHVWKTKYTIEKLEAASGELLNMIKDVEFIIENAEKNGWSPKEQAKGWAQQGRNIKKLADEIVTKYKVGCIPDPSSGAIRILLHSPCDALWMRVLNGEAVMRFDDVKEHKAKGEIYEEGRFDAVATNSVEYDKVRILAIVAALLLTAGALFFIFLRDEYSCEAIESQLASVDHTASSEVQHNSIEEVEQRLADLDKVKVCAFTQYRDLARSQSYQSAPVMIRVTAPRHPSRLRVPIDLVILLDISSAGANESLNQATGGAMFVIHNLEPHDRLSILLASETRQAHLLFPLTHMSDQQKKIAKCIISCLSLHEHIDIVSFEPGKIIRAAYQILEERSDKNPVSSIMVLTDGYDVSRLDAEKLSGNYPVYTFGIGCDHDPCRMYELATGGRGTYSFADPQDPKSSIRDAMALCIGGLMSVVAQRVKIYIDSAHRDVRISRISCGTYDHVVEDGMLTRPIAIDDLCDSEEKNFLIYVKVPAEEGAASIFTRTPKRTKLFTVKATYYCPLTNADVNTDPIEVSVRRRSQADSSNISVEVASELIRAHVLETVNKIWMSSHKDTCCSTVAAAAVGWRHTANLESNMSSEMNKLRDFIKDNEDAMAAKDRWDDLMTDLERMQDSETGLHYMLSWLSSYQLQRAAIPGSTSKGSFTFRTTCMQNMIDSVKTATSVYYQDVTLLLEKRKQSRLSNGSKI